MLYVTEWTLLEVQDFSIVLFTSHHRVRHSSPGGVLQALQDRSKEVRGTCNQSEISVILQYDSFAPPRHGSI